MSVQYVNYDLVMYVLITAMRDLRKEKREDLAEAVEFIAQSLRESRDDLLEDAVSREEYDLLVRRLQHLLESDYIRSFDEKEIMTGRYKRDIKEADTVPVVHTRSEYRAYRGIKRVTVSGEIVCHNCHAKHFRVEGTRLKFCPECGAKMYGR